MSTMKEKYIYDFIELFNKEVANKSSDFNSPRSLFNIMHGERASKESINYKTDVKATRLKRNSKSGYIWEDDSELKLSRLHQYIAGTTKRLLKNYGIKIEPVFMETFIEQDYNDDVPKSASIFREWNRLYYEKVVKEYDQTYNYSYWFMNLLGCENYNDILTSEMIFKFLLKLYGEIDYKIQVKHICQTSRRLLRKVMKVYNLDELKLKKIKGTLGVPVSMFVLYYGCIYSLEDTGMFSREVFKEYTI